MPSPSDDREQFRLKHVKVGHRTVPIVLQSLNGPCPLIALANVLLLRGAASLSLDPSFVSIQELSDLVGIQISERSTNGRDPNLDAQIVESLGLIPQIARGLDVNLRFSGCGAFEYTEGLTLFDVLGIRLVHGWMYDPQDAVVAKAVGELGYNQLVEKAISLASPGLAASDNNGAEPSPTSETDPTAASSTPETLSSSSSCSSSSSSSSSSTSEDPTSPSVGAPSPPVADPNAEARDGKETDSDRAALSAVLRDFLENTPSQLTYHGLTQLHEFVREGELCVLFRCNHFAVLTKREGSLFTLVTDEGYLREEAIVWEALAELEGDSRFHDAAFRPTALKSELIMAEGLRQEQANREQIAQQHAAGAPALPDDFLSFGAGQSGGGNRGPGGYASQDRGPRPADGAADIDMDTLAAVEMSLDPSIDTDEALQRALSKLSVSQQQAVINSYNAGGGASAGVAGGAAAAGTGGAHLREQHPRYQQQQQQQQQQAHGQHPPQDGDLMGSLAADEEFMRAQREEYERVTNQQRARERVDARPPRRQQQQRGDPGRDRRAHGNTQRSDDPSAGKKKEKCVVQ